MESGQLRRICKARQVQQVQAVAMEEMVAMVKTAQMERP
jgi:hypothetical protein